jgi:hypothetical protein
MHYLGTRTFGSGPVFVLRLAKNHALAAAGIELTSHIARSVGPAGLLDAMMAVSVGKKKLEACSQWRGMLYHVSAQPS